MCKHSKTEWQQQVVSSKVTKLALVCLKCGEILDAYVEDLDKIGPPIETPIEENFWDDRTTPERDG